ncbi:MAG: hypothetical protein FJ291_26420, partial [Planctomycetes bacterium]|nr:hypothetical protein [Planctomycetota bacterium]
MLLAVVLAGYAGAAVVVQGHCADLLTSDGECYLRIASYYAKGDFRHAVFGVWSPLGSWLTVPFVAAGVEARHGFRVLIGLWGALAVVGSWRLAGRLGDLGFRISDFGLKSQIADRKSQIPRVAATACVALLALEWSADQRVDLLVTGLLLLYLDAALDPRLLHSWRRALGVGALGGAAYLAKLFALPFFAAHLTCVVFARGRGRAAVRTWLLAAAGFSLVAAPWVAVLTARHGRLTFGTVAGPALTAGRLGIEDVRRATIVGLRRPPPDAYNVWQDATRPMEVPVAPAPPAGLAARIRAELGVVGRNATAIVRHLADLDRLHLGLAALALLPLAMVFARRGSEVRFAYLALALAALLYGGGYALAHVAEKRYLWLLMLLAAVAAFHFVGLLPRLL